MERKVLYLIIILFIVTTKSQAQTNISDSLIHQGLQRKFIIHLPPDFTPQDSIPLIIVLHGGSGDAFSAQGFTRMNSVSNEFGFAVAYPEGIAESGIGGFTWADGRGTPADDMGIDDVGFINKMVDNILSEYPILFKRVYLCGFSNGGFLTQKIACESNERFAAMASLGSTQDIILNATCNPERPIPTMIITGTNDPLVPYQGGPMDGDVPDIVSSQDLIDFWRSNNNCRTIGDSLDLPNPIIDDSSTVTSFEFIDCDCNADIKHLRINGGGHTWPGVELPDYELIAGQTNEDIQASLELWKFFSQYELCNDLITSIEEDKTQGFLNIYPNPAQQSTVIESSHPYTQLKLFDTNGKLINQIDFNSLKTEIPLHQLTSGIYFIKIIYPDGTYSTKQLIKP